MKDVRISFVILTWNSRKFVSACLESVLGLGDVCLEVHVEDNGSTDGTPEMLEALAVSDRRLHVEYLDSNLGTTVSRNLALRRVSPEATHVCVLDSDTVINREAFHLMVEALQRDSRIGVVGPTMMSSSGDVQHSGRNLPTFAIKVGKACPFEKLSKRAHEAEIPTTPIIGGLQEDVYKRQEQHQRKGLALGSWRKSFAAGCPSPARRRQPLRMDRDVPMGFAAYSYDRQRGKAAALKALAVRPSTPKVRAGGGL